MDTSRKPRQNSEYLLEALDGELLLYHIGKTHSLYLNPTASLIWQICDGSRSVDRIVDILMEAYPDAVGDLAADVISTLEKLILQDAILLE